MGAHSYPGHGLLRLCTVCATRALARVVRVLADYWYAHPDLLGGFLDGASGTVAGLVPLAGLAERLSAGSHDLWICLLVVTLFFRRRRREVTMK